MSVKLRTMLERWVIKNSERSERGRVTSGFALIRFNSEVRTVSVVFRTFWSETSAFKKTIKKMCWIREKKEKEKEKQNLKTWVLELSILLVEFGEGQDWYRKMMHTKNSLKIFIFCNRKDSLNIIYTCHLSVVMWKKSVGTWNGCKSKL